MASADWSIAIDGRPFVGGYSGYTTYLESIIEPLLERGFRVTLVSNQPLNPAHTVAEQCAVEIFGSARSVVWEQRDVPKFLKSHHHDVYFVGTNRGLPWLKARGTRYILGLLDIIPYKFPLQYLTNARFIVRELRPGAQLISVIRADGLVTISQQSAHDIQRLFHRRARALWLRLKQLPTPVVTPKPQFVYVGGVDRRKKIDNLIRAFAEFSRRRPGYRLILIGRGYDIFNGLMQELGVAEAVKMTGFVDAETKMRLLAESTALVYPSLYEGYGLAIAEGFMAGVPVIAGPGGSQAEIGGEAVLYANPSDPIDLARAMEEVLQPATRRQLDEARERQMKRIFGAHIDEAIGDYFMDQAKKARAQRG